MNELSLRILSGGLFFLIFCVMTWMGVWGLSFLAAVCLIILLNEWKKVSSGILRWAAFLWSLAGITAFVWVIHQSIPWALFTLSIIFATDISSYFGGRAIGGPKMAPSISPGKTMGGFGSGLMGAIAMAFLWSTPLPFFSQAALAFVIAAASISGDLLESFLKRKCGVKDSGSLLPGHGGIADRLDSALFVFPLLAFLDLPQGEFSLFKIPLTGL